MLTNLSFDASLCDLLFRCCGQYFFLVDHAGSCHWSSNASERLALPDATLQEEAFWKQLLPAEELTLFLRDLREVSSGWLQSAQGHFHLRATAGGHMRARIDLQASELPGVRCVGTVSDLNAGAFFDPVTGLRGSSDFCADLEEITRNAEPWGVLVIGLDAFRRINDLHSYSFGDEVLRAFARALQKHLLKNAQLYRLDSDRFGLLCPGVSRAELAQIFAQLQEISLHPFMVRDTRVMLNFSGAGCLYPDDSEDPENLFRFARIALDAAKASGGNQFQLYSQELSAQTQRDLLMLEKLRESVLNDYEGFSLNYQPLVFSKDGTLYGCEVLLRWKNPAFPEGVSPFEFVPVLDDSGLMLQVGEWIIRQALHQLSKWVVFKPDFQMSINATCAQFENPEFRFFVLDSLTREKINPNLLTLELTESNQIVNTEVISRAFDFFRSQGIKIAFDDFGMGYASLDIFRILSADELKIDRSFLERLSYDVTDQKIIGHLISLCHSMNMNVCVEGVESPEVVNIIQQLGPLLLQGYYYNKPMTAEDFEKFYFSSIQLPKLTAPHKLPIDTSHLSELSLFSSARRPAQPLTNDKLVDSVYAGIIQVGIDEQFTFLSCNEGYRRMLGYTAREIQEKFKNQALDFVYPDDKAFVTSEIQRQLGLGDTLTSEFRVQRADGSPLWVAGVGNVVRGRGGSTSLSVLLVDIDQFKRQAIADAQSGKRAVSVLSHLPAGVKCVRYDAHFTLEYISPAHLHLLGYTEQELRRHCANKYLSVILAEDQQAVQASLRGQFAHGDVATLRYRVRCKNGQLLRLETINRLCPPGEDGVARLYSCVSSITDAAIEDRRGLSDLASRYRQAAANWGDMLFEFDFQQRQPRFSKSFSAILGRDTSDTFDGEMAHVHPDDRPHLLHMVEQVGRGIPCDGVELRSRNADGNYVWFVVHLDAPAFVDGKPTVAIGKVHCIDSEKRERLRLLEQSRTDSLTGLHNRNALEEEISSALMQARGRDRFCMLIADISDFKRINELMGHPYGDELLRRMADRLREQFAQDTLLCRTGGDEFILFSPLPEDVHAYGKQVFSALCGEYCLEDGCYDVTVNVGIAITPDDGTTFAELYRSADSALYRAKAIGPGSLCLFSQ